MDTFSFTLGVYRERKDKISMPSYTASDMTPMFGGHKTVSGLRLSGPQNQVGLYSEGGGWGAGGGAIRPL